jgi:hypothetical protein
VRGESGRRVSPYRYARVAPPFERPDDESNQELVDGPTWGRCWPRPGCRCLSHLGRQRPIRPHARMHSRSIAVRSSSCIRATACGLNVDVSGGWCVGGVLGGGVGFVVGRAAGVENQPGVPRRGGDALQRLRCDRRAVRGRVVCRAFARPRVGGGGVARLASRTHTSKGWMRRNYARPGADRRRHAQPCRRRARSPFDYDELGRWTRVGFERGTRSLNGER